MKKPIIAVVTGASGLIGHELSAALLEEGVVVYGLYKSNRARLKPLLNHPNFHGVKTDITNSKSLNRLFKRVKPEVVFHTAAQLRSKLKGKASAEDPKPFFTTNVQGTLNLLEASRLHQVKTFIHSSSMGVYGKKIDSLPVKEDAPLLPDDFYAFTKHLSETLCAFYAGKYALNTVILRYSGVFGPERPEGAVANFIRCALKGSPLKINSNLAWDIIDARDAAQANVLAYKKAPKIKYAVINIGCGYPVGIDDLAEKIITLSGSKSKITLGPSYATSAWRFYLDIERAKQVLNFTPTPLDTGLKRFLKSLRHDRDHSSA